MAAEHQRFVTSEDDDDDDGDTIIDVKEEDDEDVDEGEKNFKPPTIVGVSGASTGSDTSFWDHQPYQGLSTPPQGRTRKRRPQEEKERTKLRERQRRAVTAKILAGLRKHGNYNLKPRSDINDVIAALAREAGWEVEPDGTTYPVSRSQGSKPSGGKSNRVVASSPSEMPVLQTPPVSLIAFSSGYRNKVDYDACQLGSVFVSTASPFVASPRMRSQTATFVGDGGDAQNDPLLQGSIDSIDNRLAPNIPLPTELKEPDFAGTPYVPVYVMLPLGVINKKCELSDPAGLIEQLRVLKSVNVDGVMVDCWWGIVEAHAPQEYNWNGYRMLFQIVHKLKLKLQVVMSFHGFGFAGDDVYIPLPGWVAEIGQSNPDIFFTDGAGRRNPECLSWGIDNERVLRGRTATEVYYDYMRSFRVEFNDFFEDDIISLIEIGLGPCGELRYPAHPVKHGWRYPGVGEFQCYDQYLLKRLMKAAEARGHSSWARGPDNAGSYNSKPDETGFFSEGGDYDGYYGRFFLSWYSQVLVEHGDRVLSLAKLTFEDTCIAAKLSAIPWWYKTASHAPELTAGFYNSCNRDGYAAIVALLKKHGVTLKFTCAGGLNMLNEQVIFSESLADPEGLYWQVVNAAWGASVPVASENALPCHDRESYNYLLKKAKSINDPDKRHFSAFTYRRLCSRLMERPNFLEFELFIKRMHGQADLEA